MGVSVNASRSGRPHGGGEEAPRPATLKRCVPEIRSLRPSALGLMGWRQAIKRPCLILSHGEHDSSHLGLFRTRRTPILTVHWPFPLLPCFVKGCEPAPEEPEHSSSRTRSEKRSERSSQHSQACQVSEQHRPCVQSPGERWSLYYRCCYGTKGLVYAPVASRPQHRPRGRTSTKESCTTLHAPSQ